LPLNPLSSPLINMFSSPLINLFINLLNLNLFINLFINLLNLNQFNLFNLNPLSSPLSSQCINPLSINQNQNQQMNRIII